LNWFKNLLKALGVSGGETPGEEFPAQSRQPDDSPSSSTSAGEAVPGTEHHTPEVKPDGISQSDFDFELGRRIFAEGDIQHAAFHLAWALAADPTRSEWLDLLEQLFESSGGKLLPLAQNATESSYAEEAIRAYCAAKKERFNEAVRSLLMVTNAKPDARYAVTWMFEWLSADAALKSLDETLVGQMMILLKPYRDYLENTAADRAEMRKLLSLIDRYLQLKPSTNIYIFYMRCALLRKLGRFEESLQAAKDLFEKSPGYLTAVGLSMSYKFAGDFDAAVKTLKKAQEFKPDDIQIRLDLGDLYLDRDDWKEALSNYQEVLEIDPSDNWALPSVYYCRHKISRETAWVDQLITLSESGNQRAAELYNQLLPYTGYLPEASEASANALRQFIENLKSTRSGSSPDSSGMKSMTVSALEAPSCFMSINLQLASLGLSPLQEIKVTAVQTPDPREPLAAVKHLLWRYEGTNPIPVQRACTDNVREAVTKLASRSYNYRLNWIESKKVALELKPEHLDSLLGIMVCPPPLPEGTDALQWVQRLQLAAAYLLANIDSGWQGSARREVLLDIARGPVDWTVEAAVIALTRVAQEEQSAREETCDLFVSLLKRVPESTYCCYVNGLLYNWLLIPGLSRDEREAILSKLSGWTAENK
jgi:tetratricopeptide (TPR) repeat protein